MANSIVYCQQCIEHHRGMVQMKLLPGHNETRTAWQFYCPRCGCHQIWTKNKAGGTFGQGARDDGVRSAYGRGFGRGSHPNAIT